MHLSLIGYRGTGKTTIAAALSEQFHVPWIDADIELERRAGKSIAKIFADQGEAHFRDLESQVLSDLSQQPQLIVSVGGGGILRAENRAVLQASGPVIWLQAHPETILQRMMEDPTTATRRPSLTALDGLEEIKTLLAQRTPLYAQCATLCIDTEGKQPAEIVAEIQSAWRE